MFDSLLHQSRSVWLANYLLESIDETVDPCENFFQFACGTWIKNAKIPDSGKIFLAISDRPESFDLSFSANSLSTFSALRTQLNNIVIGKWYIIFIVHVIFHLFRSSFLVIVEWDC
jgi:hypothetical protein